MPPIRADHGLSWKKGSPHGGVAAAGGDGEERAKQPRRSTPLTKRPSPSHSRTPSPNQQPPSVAGMVTVHATTHGHVFAHGGARRSPSSKTSNTGSSSRSAFADSSSSGPREKRRASPDPARKGYAHAHVSQRGLGSKSPAFGPPLKGPSARGSGSASWGVSSPTPGVGGARTNSSPTPPAGASGNGRGHSSPTLARGGGGGSGGGSDVTTAAAAGDPSAAGGGGGGNAVPGHLSSTSALPLPRSGSAEVREMTQLDRVFLEQPHEGRKDVEGDDLHLCNEIQRHLQSRVQSQQSQLMEATSGRARASFGGGSSGGGNTVAVPHQAQGVPDSNSFVDDEEMELINDDNSCYSPDTVHDDPRSIRDTGSSFASVPVVGGSDLLDDPDLGSAGVPPVSPSSGGGPAQGLVLDVGPMDYLLDTAAAAQVRGGGVSREVVRGGPGSRSPLGSALAPDVQMGEGGEGQLREVVNGLEAMDLDDVDRALALLTAQKERIMARKEQYAEQHQAQAQAQAHATLVPPQLPLQPASNGVPSSNRAGSSSRQRRSSGRSRHGGESSPSAGGRSEAFGVSGGGVRGAPTSFSRAPRGQGRPPPVPGHLSASTAAMRRSSPGSIASLAELDSYLEHHHRRLVEQVEGGVVADDVEAEIKASRHPRRGTRSHQRFGSGPGSNGLGGSSSSSNSVPRTVGARVSTGSFFHSTLSAEGDGDDDGDDVHNAGWIAKDGRSDPRGWDPPHRGPGYKRERGEIRGGGADGGWGASPREFRGADDTGDEERGSAFLGVSATTSHSQTSSPPPSIMSSDDVSVSSYGHPVTVLPGSPNNLTFAGRPPPSLARIRLEAVRSPVVRHGRAERGRGGLEDGPVFTSPDASKHVHELCSPRSAFTPRSASSVSSLASSPARRR